MVNFLREKAAVEAAVLGIERGTRWRPLSHVVCAGCRSLEALPVDNGGAGLVVLLLGDPHLLEGGEGGQDGAADPDAVLPTQQKALCRHLWTLIIIFKRKFPLVLDKVLTTT